MRARVSGPAPDAGAALMDGEDEKSREGLQQHPAWRVTVFYGIGAAVFVLTTNIVVLAWAKTSLPLSEGIATAYTGDVTTTPKWRSLC